MLQVFGQSGKPVLDRFRCLTGPLDQEPFRSMRFTAPVIAMSRTDAHSSKTRAQGLTSSFPPAHRLPSRARQAPGQLAHGDGTVSLSAIAITSWGDRFLSTSAWVTGLGRAATHSRRT